MKQDFRNKFVDAPVSKKQSIEIYKQIEILNHKHILKDTKCRQDVHDKIVSY